LSYRVATARNCLRRLKAGPAATLRNHAGKERCEPLPFHIGQITGHATPYLLQDPSDRPKRLRHRAVRSQVRAAGDQLFDGKAAELGAQLIGAVTIRA